MIGYLIVGAIAGAIARALMPGDKYEPKGCLMTTIVGCAGASLVGFVMHSILGAESGGFIRSTIGATIGAVIVLAIYAKVSSGKSSS